MHGELELKTKIGDHSRIVAGTASQGFANVEVNGAQIRTADTVLLAGDLGTVSRNSSHVASVLLENWDFGFENSDMFVNQRVRVLDSRVLRPHGFLRHTWRIIITQPR